MSAHVLWDGKGAIVDLVFVHGLNGHHMDTWSKGKVCWPQQLLNKDIPQSRIITWGYEADLVNFVGSASHASIFMHADNLLTDIGNLRRGCNNRPLIFLCHSLGGLVVKEALINANISFHNEDNPRRASIFENTKGIIFFGTPHRGSPTMSHADLVSKTAKVVLHKSNERLIHALREESQLLDIQRTRFSAVGKDVKIVCFSEEREMSVGMIVPLHSAVIDGHGVLVSSIPENHSNMCKFKEGAVGYVRTKEYLLDMIESFGAGKDLNSSMLLEPDRASDEFEVHRRKTERKSFV
ncbi:hypothetical protein BJY04DRAFT_105403 [Aspergillus karnatakaensis]|uniref:esterase/lipase family protein n=1 Tax=Aspergillus karnatakaensis TaxID=1810916 RepID=UPI003CCD39C3